MCEKHILSSRKCNSYDKFPSLNFPYFDFVWLIFNTHHISMFTNFWGVTFPTSLCFRHSYPFPRIVPHFHMFDGWNFKHVSISTHTYFQILEGSHFKCISVSETHTCSPYHTTYLYVYLNDVLHEWKWWFLYAYCGPSHKIMFLHLYLLLV